MANDDLEVKANNSTNLRQSSSKRVNKCLLVRCFLRFLPKRLQSSASAPSGRDQRPRLPHPPTSKEKQKAEMREIDIYLFC